MEPNDEDRLKYAHELHVFEIIEFAPHCNFCHDEIIDNMHVLVPFKPDEKTKTYMPLCEACYFEKFIQGDYETEEDEDCQE